MIALDDAALARVAIAATGVPVRRRSAWLQALARALEGAPPAAPSARRMRQWRERQRDGRLLVRVELGEAEVEALIALSLLPSHLADERNAVAEAVSRLLKVLPKL